MKEKISVFILVISIVLLLIGCAKKVETYTIEVLDGVKYVENSGQPADPNFSVKLDKEFEILGYNEIENPDTLYFFVIKHLVTDDHGNIYCYDPSSLKIYSYDKDGEFINSWGQEGQGPNDFETLDIYYTLANDKFIVKTFSELKIFTKEGECISRITPNVRKGILKMRNFNNRLVEEEFHMKKTGDSGDRMKDLSVVKSISIYPTTSDLQDSEPITQFSETIAEMLDYSTNTAVANEDLLFTNSSEYLYTTKAQKGKLEIVKLNSELDTISVIRNLAAEKPYSQSEKEYAISLIGKLFQEHAAPVLPKVYDIKYGAHQLHYDNVNDLLIVEKEADLDALTIRFDVYKNDVYMNYFEFPIAKENYQMRGQWFAKFAFQINNGRLYYVNQTENKIEIYNILLSN